MHTIYGSTCLRASPGDCGCDRRWPVCGVVSYIVIKSNIHRPQMSHARIGGFKEVHSGSRHIMTGQTYPVDEISNGSHGCCRRGRTSEVGILHQGNHEYHKCGEIYNGRKVTSHTGSLINNNQTKFSFIKASASLVCSPNINGGVPNVAA